MLRDTGHVTDLVSRDYELASLIDVGLEGGPAAALLVGDPGMGKTTLVRALLAALAALSGTQARTVLTARPLESERSMAFSGLSALLTEVDPTMLSELPAQQASSLRAALLLEEFTAAVDPRAVAAGLRGVLEMLSARRPVVLVIDDAQWLDASSAGALGQALHRIGNSPVTVICSSRPAGDELRWLTSSGLPIRAEVHLAGMANDDLVRVVRTHLGALMEPADLRGVARSSAGNPLHALELARRRFAAGAGLTVEQLVRDRLAALPRETRIALATAALASDPHLEVIAQARSCSALQLAANVDPAVRAGLVAVSNVVLFSHPLYAEAAILAISVPDRADAHRRLAAAEPSDEARARHIGLAAAEPDEDLASSLAATAARTRARGAWDASVELLTLAVERTPPDSPERANRALLLGRWAFQGGQPALAEAWFVDVRDKHPGSTSYWVATMGLARLCLHDGRTAELHALNQQLLEAELDPLLAAEAMLRTVNDEFADRPAERIMRIAEANGMLAAAGTDVDPELLVTGLSLEIQARLRAGQPTDDLLARAVALDAQHPAAIALDAPSLELAYIAMMADRFDEGRAICLSTLRRCHDSGDDVSLPTVYSHLAHLEQRAGRWADARRALDEGERSAQGHGPIVLWQLRAQRALLDGLQGHRDAGLDALRQAGELFAAPEYAQFGAILNVLSGRVHAAYGDHQEAYEAFSRAVLLARQIGWDDPANLEADVPLAEAALHLGHVDEAERHLAETELRAAELGQSNQLAVCIRGRIALAGAQGDLHEAARLVPTLLDTYAREPGQPIDLALALISAGRVLRRTRRKREAHELISSALGILEGLGCTPYVLSARSELRRVGLRPRRPETLSATEAQVARLAADGLRNAEIATAAHLSVKTVEAVLSRTYRKLGIRSRAQLGQALLGLGTPTHGT